MKPTYLLIILLFTSVVYGQSNWLYRGGGNSHDEALDIATDASGNYYMTGYKTGDAEFGELAASAARHRGFRCDLQRGCGLGPRRRGMHTKSPTLIFSIFSFFDFLYSISWWGLAII